MQTYETPEMEIFDFEKENVMTDIISISPIIPGPDGENELPII